MNTSVLETFARDTRKQLMDAVARKLDYVLSADTADLRAAAAQVGTLRAAARRDQPALVERVAYTWFNRLAALRFLDARDWHPFRARVLTAAGGESQPELLKLFREGALPDELARFAPVKRLNDLLDGRLPPAIAGADPQGEVYRHLILAACRYYHDLVPFLFEAIDDETELLLPDDLLTGHSIAEGFRTGIADADCAEVEVLGWLYQFYISEKKDQVMARKTAVPSADIPAVTQLFTPHWIVRYLVENSLGRLWMLNHPDSGLRAHMPYYIEGDPETEFLRIERPEDIRLIDPACGSGHMLTYAFDLLVRIYEEAGYPAADIPALILTHNLHGLEICPRATQLAQFALVCKARERSRAAFRQPIQPRVMCLRDVVIEPDELNAWLRATKLQRAFSGKALEQLQQFRANTDTFGSLIQPLLSAGEIAALKAAMGDEAPPGGLFLQETHRKIRLVLDQAEMLTQRYHVVVANPPYMGGKGMNSDIKWYLGQYFADYKSDLFAAFIVRSLSLTLGDGYLGFMSPFVWMFISSYEKLRRHLISESTITTLVQLEYSGFDGATVPICTFALQNRADLNFRGAYIRLSDFRGSEIQGPKTLEAIANRNCGWFFRTSAKDFRKLPGSPIAYWVSPKIRESFSVGRALESIAKPRVGLQTGDNARFVRYWHEVHDSAKALHSHNRTEAERTGLKWFPYNKGGDFRRWYGNQEFIVNWEHDGLLIRSFLDEEGNLRSRPQNMDYYFAPSVSWSKISSGMPAFRYFPPGFLFDVAGTSIFADTEATRLNLLGFTNSLVARKMLEAISPTLNFEVGHIASLPVILPKDISNKSTLFEDLVSAARADWDNFETSWDFQDEPLLRPELKGTALEASWWNWEAQCTAAIGRMQGHETENNRLWIDAYGLQDEMSPDVPEDQITLARADPRKDMAAFLSYAVGCMMGRYSLEKPGLILADAGDTLETYLTKVGKPRKQLAFVPDEDGIIPVLDGEWFGDDVVARVREFLRVTFGPETLDENVRFIEASLGKDLRAYFVSQFYKDHLQTYKKRPIYWLFQSPRKSFQCLVYLHRYTRDTANRVLNRYLREYLAKLRAAIEQRERTLASQTAFARDKTLARKAGEQYRKALRECEEWERAVLLPLAQQRVELDLDDGVKVNYLKLGEALSPIPGLAAAEEA